MPSWKTSLQRLKEIETEYIRKLSNFNFQWTKTLYQNNLNNITFFCAFFKGYRCKSGASAQSARSGAPWVIKFGKLSIRENSVMTSPYVRPYVRTDFPGRVSRNEFLNSPLKVCPLLFLKPLEMMTNQNLSTDQMFGGF